MAAVVATGAEATIRLAPGVKPLSVLDRAHRIEGSATGASVIVHVPLGQFTRTERKTVLLKVALEATHDDQAPVGEVEVTYREIGAGSASKVTGVLAVPVGSGHQAATHRFLRCCDGGNRTAQTHE